MKQTHESNRVLAAGKVLEKSPKENPKTAIHPSRTKRMTLICVAAMALCLALPPSVCLAWDALLFCTPQPRTEEAGVVPALSEAGRTSEPACLLYSSAHLLHLSVGRDVFESSTGWTATPAPENDPDFTQARARCAATVKQLAVAGLLSKAQGRAAEMALGNTNQPLTIQSGPAGLTAYALDAWVEATAATPENAQTAESGKPSVTLLVLLTPAGVPLYFDFQDSRELGPEELNEPARPGSLATLLALYGLDGFTDWQQASWKSRAMPDAGEAAYSKSGQLYAAINYRCGLNFSLASMTPEEFDALP